MVPRQSLNPHPTDSESTLLSEKPIATRKRRWWIWLLLLLIAGMAVWYFRGQAAKNSQRSATAKSGRTGNQAMPVAIATAQKTNLPVYFTGLGTATAYYTVTVHTRVDGQIMMVYFREGQFVHKGEALVEIDPRQYQVQLEQAEGQLSKDQASLNDASVNLNRDTSLYSAGIIPKQQLDTQTATVKQGQGAVTADQAAIDNVKLQLAYCHVTAPISGRIGLRLVDPGNIVHASDPNGLIVITQLQPIAVIFTLPQDELDEVYKELRSHDRLPVDAYDRNDTTKIASGFLETIDNQIDTSTGTYKLKAVFNNQDNALFPNQFVNVHLLVNTQKDVTVVPAAAVQRGPQGTYIYVVQGDTARVRSVTPGITQGNLIAINSGVQPGEQVVTDGLDKLTDGSKIRPTSPTGGAPAAESSPSSPAPNASKPGATLNDASAPKELPARRHRPGGPQQ